MELMPHLHGDNKMPFEFRIRSCFVVKPRGFLGGEPNYTILRSQSVLVNKEDMKLPTLSQLCPCLV